MKGKGWGGCGLFLALPAFLAFAWAVENINTILVALIGAGVLILGLVLLTGYLDSGQSPASTPTPSSHSSSSTNDNPYYDYYRHKVRTARSTPDYPIGDGRAFEQHIRNRLISRGYQVRETPGSGDYGVDLLADHYGHKVAIQAKNHAKPVGVRAVQEAHAGLRYYGADEAWVVSRSGFTQQAQTLAKATGVRLVDVKHL